MQPLPPRYPSGRSRPAPSLEFERQLRVHGQSVIAGFDEVGRGAWAGPLVGAVVILPAEIQLPGVHDSKLLSPATRQRLEPQIRAAALAYGIGVVTLEELNREGLAHGLRLILERSLAALAVRPDHLLLDGKVTWPDLGLPQSAIVQGDQRSLTIAAASILAKVARDQMMVELHQIDAAIQVFHFDRNKGYPSLHHRQTLKRVGPSPHHRTQFQPIRELLS